MKKSIITILFTGLTASASFGATTYLNTDFEGETVGEFSASSNTTGLINDADNTSNVEIVGNLTSTVSTLNDPSGQHLQIRGNRNKRATQENAMTLITDGVTTLNISFSYYFSNTADTNDGRVLYSALGDFSDEVLLASYDAASLSANQWFLTSFAVNSTDVGITFTDTAKVRFANDGGGAFGDSFVIDDVFVQGIPEPSSTALLGMGGLALFLRRRR